ncbi:MAG: glycoside hydrolase family 3 C-terminal domain-containing protein [Burkholderiales bacterium]|nr:glycoside hydrolase family 3 C-terminal domain-containing protein [Burkholderiales bacterium]
MSSSRIDSLLAEMTLAEKIGQLCQVQPHGRDQEDLVRAGGAGSLINVVGDDAYHYQWLAVEHSRLRIPLLLGRDVIHGFSTVFPIPLGQAASFDPPGVREAAATAARQAAGAGVNWTFSPMLDVVRDPRWGRVAESFGEDPLLASRLGVAMVEGYQGEGVAACAKHFVGYGAAQGGRDYSETAIPPRQLHEVYLPPFEAAVAAGALTVMTGFNDLDGLPMSGHGPLVQGLLKDRWGFEGLVVSDWNSITEMAVHGTAGDESECARQALAAGVDMEMASSSYRHHLEALLERGAVSPQRLDDAVRRVLRVKERLGLFETPYGRSRPAETPATAAFQARQLARRSCVLLENHALLPLGENVGRVAVVGPLADAGHDQLGCWVFDADHGATHSVLAGIRERLGDRRVSFERGLDRCRSDDEHGFQAALDAARSADVVVLCIGEDAGLSGEAHCRAFIELPGAQQRLLDQLAATGVPVVAVVFTGRPLALGAVADKARALLLAWHPGSLGGPAIADLLFGESPSGRLPMTLPRSVGQIPLYYNHKNTGRPPDPDSPRVPSGTPLDPSGFFAAYLDEDHRPQYPFGYGLGYTRFEYADLELTPNVLAPGGTLAASFTLRNVGGRAGTEVVQLYVQDLVASVTRPVRELKDFRRVSLEAGESRRIEFELRGEQLAFRGLEGERIVEPGRFRLWLAAHSQTGLSAEFEYAERIADPVGQRDEAPTEEVPAELP